MKPYENILFVVPPTMERTPGLHRAADLARASGAALHLCAIVYSTAYDLALQRVGDEVSGRVRHDIVEECRGKLRRLASELAADGKAIEYDVVWSAEPAQAVCAKARAVHADVLIKDAKHESVLNRMLFTPLDWKLIRMAPCDLLMVAPGAAAKPRQVAAAVDLQTEPAGVDGLNGRIVQAAARLAGCFDARLELVSVFPVLPKLQHSEWPTIHAMYVEADREHGEAFNAFAQAHGIAADRRFRPTGIVTNELCHFAASHQVGVLVMGSVHRTGWERFLLGSTTESVAQAIDSDLLIVKPAGFSDLLPQWTGAARSLSCP